MVDLEKLLNSLTPEEIIKIMFSLGAEKYQEKEDCIIFPTICHHQNEEDASMKLYYYKKNKKFHCYTDCSENFNLLSLIEKVFILHGKNKVNSQEEKKNPEDFCFYDQVQFILNQTKKEEDFLFFKNNVYKSQKEKYQRKNRQLTLPIYSDKVLETFEKFYPEEWIQEGINKKSMDIFNIKYSISRNKIIIPHYNINNQLIGIRGRALNKEDIELFGKYAPIEVENIWYKHPLSQNLYGLNLSKDNIKRKGIVIIFEGEKSCLLYDTYFGEKENISVACCGSVINKAQIQLLLSNCNPREIVIAFDKEFEKSNSQQGVKYFNKLLKICEKYKNYVNLSFIFDQNNLLKLKDSPIDRGKEVFLKLYKKRVIVK